MASSTETMAITTISSINVNPRERARVVLKLDRLQEARVTHLAVVREQFLSHFSEGELETLASMWERIAPCNGC